MNTTAASLELATLALAVLVLAWDLIVPARKANPRRGGLFVYPLMDWLSWPFYRAGKHDHPVRRLFERAAGWDYMVDFGRASYGVLVALRRAG